MTTPAPASEADSAHYASYGTQEAQYGDFTTYGHYDATGFQQTTGTFDTDPLFGSMPGENTGSYDSGQWSTGQQTLNYDAYAAQHHASYDTGAYETTAWSAEYQQLSSVPPQSTSPEASGQWDAGAWLQPDQPAGPADQTQHWEWGTQTFDTGAYDATQWNSDGATTGAQEYEEPLSGEAESAATGDTGELHAVAPSSTTRRRPPRRPPPSRPRAPAPPPAPRPGPAARPPPSAPHC